MLKSYPEKIRNTFVQLSPNSSVRGLQVPDHDRGWRGGTFLKPSAGVINSLLTVLAAVSLKLYTLLPISIH